MPSEKVSIGAKLSSIRLFGNDPDLRMLVTMFLPIFIDMILNNVIGTVHAYFLADAGETVISAINLVNQVNGLISTLFFAACSATMVIVAQLRGAGKHEEAARAVGQTMFFTIYGTGAIAVLFSIFSSQIMMLFFGNIDTSIMSEAIKYIPLLGISLPFYAVFQVCACASRGFDNQRIPLIISVSGSIVNVILAFVLITVLKLGVIGAGVSLIISRFASALFGYLFLSKLKWISPLKDCVRVRLHVIKPVLTLGFYNSIANVITSYASTIKTGFLSSFSIAHISASSIFSPFASLLNVPTSVITTMITTLVARNLALGDIKRAKQLIWKCFTYNIILNALVYVAAYFILPHLFKSYTQTPETLELLRGLLIITCILTPVISTYVSTLALSFNSAGDARFSTVVNIGCMLVFNLGFGYVFTVVLNGGVLGSYLSAHLSAIAKAVIFTVRYKSDRWLHKLEL